MGETLILMLPALLLFALSWVGILNFVATISGWKRLAKELKSHSLQLGLGGDQKQFYWTSGRINWANYNNCLNISTSRFGLKLNMVKVFSFGHSTLFIPWDHVQSLELKTGLLSSSAYLVLKDSKQTKLQFLAKVFQNNSHVPASLQGLTNSPQNPY